MTKHERWVIYPLLFLSIGMWFRDRVMPSHRPALVVNELEAGEIRRVRHLQCDELLVRNLFVDQQLQVLGADQRPTVILDRGQGAGLVEVFGRDQRPMVRLSGDAGGQTGTLQVWAHSRNADGAVHSMATVDLGRGADFLELRGSDARPVVRLGGDPAGLSGIWTLWSYPLKKMLTQRAGQPLVEEPLVERASKKGPAVEEKNNQPREK